MKKGLFAAIAVISIQNVYAQNSNPWPISGPVGIGTNSPVSTLHVIGTGTFASASGGFVWPNSLVPLHVTGAQAGMGFVDRALTAAPGTPVAGDRFVWLNNAKTLRLQTDVKGEFLGITAAGNLGIGTVTPLVKLDIFESGVPPLMRIQDGDLTIPNYSTAGFNPALTTNTVVQLGEFSTNFGGVQIAGFSNTTDSRAVALIGYSGKTTVDQPVFNFYARKHNGTTSYGSLTGAEPAYDFTNNGISLARMLANGNIGIGTTTPATLLHINAATGNNPIITLSGTDVAQPFTTIVPASIGGRVYAPGAQGGLIEQGFTDSDNTAVRIQGHIGVTAPTKAALLLEAFKQSGTNRTALTGTEIALLAGAGDLNAAPTSAAFAILANGNVGVGTTVPKAKLAVNGDILSKKVKVTQLNWPDYVFHDDYKLPSLEEVEKHIQQHGHLQGIPSAEEVKKEGLDVGEQQAALLKKIEELTLYMIEQNKKLEQQVKQNEEQRVEMQSLKKEMTELRKRK